MILSALALLALAPEETKFVCHTELPRKATKAQLRAGAIANLDYPDIHHQYDDEKVEACVAVGVDGRVASCQAHGAKNIGVNEHTCKIITRRFRYEPAKDRKKRPISSFVIQKVFWKFSDI